MLESLYSNESAVPLWHCILCGEWWTPSHRTRDFWWAGAGIDPDEGYWLPVPICPSCGQMAEHLWGMAYYRGKLLPYYRKYRTYGQWRKEH